MQVQPSFDAGVGSVLHRELSEEFGLMLVTFRCSVVVSTRIRSCPVVLCCFGIFLLVLTRSRAVMFCMMIAYVMFCVKWRV